MLQAAAQAERDNGDDPSKAGARPRATAGDGDEAAAAARDEGLRRQSAAATAGPARGWAGLVGGDGFF